MLLYLLYDFYVFYINLEENTNSERGMHDEFIELTRI